MSNHTELPQLEEAADYLVWAGDQAFLQKMAELGFPANSEQEAMDLLELGEKVAAHCQNTDGAGESLYKNAALAIDHWADQHGQNQTSQRISEAHAVAADLLTDPEMYKRAAVLAAYQAQAEAANLPQGVQ